MSSLGLTASQAWGESVVTDVPRVNEIPINARLSALPSPSELPSLLSSTLSSRESRGLTNPAKTNLTDSLTLNSARVSLAPLPLIRSRAQPLMPSLEASSRFSLEAKPNVFIKPEADLGWETPSLSTRFSDRDLSGEVTSDADFSNYWVLTEPQPVVEFAGSQTWGIHVDVLEDRGSYYGANFERLAWTLPETSDANTLIHWKTTGVSEETDPWDPTHNEYRDGGVIRVENFDVPAHRLYWSVEGNPMEDISDAATVMEVNDLTPFGVVHIKPNGVLSVNTPKTEEGLAAHLAANAGIFWCQSNVIRDDRVLTPHALLAIGQPTDFSGVHMEVGEALDSEVNEGVSEAALTVRSNGVLVLELSREDEDTRSTSLINVGDGRVHFAKGSVIVLRREGDMMMPSHERRSDKLRNETEKLAKVTSRSLINAEAVVEGLEDVEVYVERANQSFVKLTPEEKARWGLRTSTKATPPISSEGESVETSSSSTTPSVPSVPTLPSTSEVTGPSVETGNVSKPEIDETKERETESESTAPEGATEEPIVTPSLDVMFMDERVIARQDKVRQQAALRMAEHPSASNVRVQAMRLFAQLAAYETLAEERPADLPVRHAGAIVDDEEEAEALRLASLRRVVELQNTRIAEGRANTSSNTSSSIKENASTKSVSNEARHEPQALFVRKPAEAYWGVCHPNELYRPHRRPFPISVWTETHRARLGETTLWGKRSTLRDERALWGIGTYAHQGPWRGRLGLVMSEERWHWTSPVMQKGKAHELLVGGSLLYQWRENSALAMDWAWNQRREDVQWLAFGDDWVTSHGARSRTLWSALRLEEHGAWQENHWWAFVGLGALYQGRRHWNWRERGMDESSEITEPSHVEGHGIFGVSWQSSAWVLAGCEWYLGMNVELDWTFTKSHKTLSERFGGRTHEDAMVYPREVRSVWGLEWAHKGVDSSVSVKVHGQRGPQRQRDFGVGLLWGLPVNL